MDLNATLLRLLGCLIEKEMTTPDYYPMTVNGLTAACNQKSNREPVVGYSEQQVMDGLSELRDQGLVRAVRSPGGRAVKYKHALDDVLEIDGEQAAILAVLLLRGDQTPGELRLRTLRYHEFPDLETVEEVLNGLQNREQPLVARLDRRPGEKEARYRHLLGDGGGYRHTEATGPENPAPISKPPPTDPPEVDALRARVETLERRVSALEGELASPDLESFE